MKFTGLIRTSLLVSLLGTTAMIYAQDQHDDAKPQEPRPEATKPAHDDAKPAREQDAKPQDAKPSKPEDMKPAQNDAKPENRMDAKPSTQAEHQEKSSEHVQQAGGQRGGHIPDDKFRSNFGREHTVVINRPVIVEGQPRFQYGGYWFNIVDAWPVGWAYTDQCYIDYVDGEYFLFDLLHPGVRVAIIVVM
jgi:hypothetical protein